MNKIKIFLFFLLAGFLGGLLSLHFFSFNYIEKYLLADDRSDLIPIEITERKEVTIRENEAIMEKIEKVERAIVGIRTDTRFGSIEGSGLIISTDGLLITFSEVIPIGNNFNFFVNGNAAPYEVLRRDESSGLALVKIEENGLPALEYGNVDRLKIGERVFLVGAIFNEKGEIQKSANEGIVKRIDDYVRTNILEEDRFVGSTLFDVEGRVLGLNIINRMGEVNTLSISEIQEFIGL